MAAEEVFDEKSDFFGVYLLVSENPDPKFKGKVYIGKTTDPARRLNQHNKGKHSGGAWKTDSRGPWKMVMIVHGFLEVVSALRFEWAWQHPAKSRRLKAFKELARKTRKESQFEYRFRVVARMLNVGPWYRLPLTVRWIEVEYARSFPANLLPPEHMPIAYGEIKIPKKRPKKNRQALEDVSAGCSSSLPSTSNDQACRMCGLNVTHLTRVWCHLCQTVYHIICLSDRFLEEEDKQNPKASLLPALRFPIKGTCVQCKAAVLWGDLIRYRNGSAWVTGYE